MVVFRNHFIIETSQRENFYKNISEFCTYYVTYDFQHCSDICLMSAEIDVFEIDAEVS